MDRLGKSLDALKALQTTISTTAEEKLRKKDVSTSSKDKVAHCNAVVDNLLSQPVRAHADYPKVLSEAFETLLALCNDQVADVRLLADSCLNRLIKTLLESNATRIQVELYKELKKNGPSRTLRVALSKFAELASHIKPQKARIFAVSLLACVSAIAKRAEDAIQESLLEFVDKVWPCLGRYFNDDEVKALIKIFLPNLQLQSLVSRRTASTSLLIICQHSRKPNLFCSYILKALLDHLVPVLYDQSVYLLMGTFLALKQLIPLLKEVIDGSGREPESKLVSGGATVKINPPAAAEIDINQLLQLYEVSVYYTCSSNVSIATAALETLGILLSKTPSRLQDVLLSSSGIDKTRIYPGDFAYWASSSGTLSGLRSRRSSFSTPSGLPSLAGSQSDLTSLSLAANSDFSLILADDRPFSHPLSTTSHVSSESLSSMPAPAPIHSYSTGSGDLLVAVASEASSDIDSWTPGQIYLNADEMPTEEVPTLPDELPTIDELPSEFKGMGLEPLSPLLGGPMLDNNPCGVGTYLDPAVPLIYCARLLTAKFLLSGDGGGLMPDKEVRVSQKAAALSCFIAIVDMFPDVLLLPLRTSNAEGNISQVHVQRMLDVFLFASHSDPQLRAHTLTLCGRFLLTACVKAQHTAHARSDLIGGSDESMDASSNADLPSTIDNWLQPILDSSGFGSVGKLVLLLLAGFGDETAIVVRAAIGSIETAFDVLMHYENGQLLMELMRKMLRTAPAHPSFLVKIDLANFLSKLDYCTVAYLEELHAISASEYQDGCPLSANQSVLNIKVKRHIPVQVTVLNLVLQKLLSDDDLRVRLATAHALVSLVPRLYFGSQDICTLSRVFSKRQLSTYIGTMDYQESSAADPLPSVHGLAEPFCAPGRERCHQDVEANLSVVLETICLLFASSSSKQLTSGCISALFELSAHFKPTIYRRSWLNYDCKTSGNKGESSAHNLGCGFLALLLNTIVDGPLLLDFGTHEQTLRLLGNVLCGFVSVSIHSSSEKTNSATSTTGGATTATTTGGMTFDSRWTHLDASTSALADAVADIFTHCLRLLNLFWYVLTDTVPAGAAAAVSFANVRSQLTSNLPPAPSLPSPVKRRISAGIGGTASADIKGTGGDALKLATASGSVPKAGECIGNLQFAKLFELMRSAYVSYKVSLNESSGDKLLALLKAVLAALSQILEFSSASELSSKLTEDLLAYFRITANLAPVGSTECVMQLLKCLFGTNLNFIVAEAKTESGEPIFSGIENHFATLMRWSDASIGAGLAKIPVAKQNANSLYETAVLRPYVLYAHNFISATARHETCKGLIEKNLGWLNLRTDKHVLNILKSNSATSTTGKNLGQLIRSFEPSVIQALRLYTNTESVQLQCQVIRLLIQLIQCRVNYCLLDADFHFLQFVFQQLEGLGDCQLTSSDALISTLFEFFVVLSYEKYQTRTVVDMPKILQLCDGLLATGQNPLKEVVPALRIVTQDLFLLRPSAKLEDAKELEALREVALSMILKLLQFSEVVDLLTIVLYQTKLENDDKWRKLSRDVVDLLLPIVGKMQLNYLSNRHSRHFVARAFELASPSAFRPADHILHWLFGPTPLALLQASFCEESLAEAAFSVFKNKPALDLYAMMCSQLILLRILTVFVKEEAILGRLEQMNIRLSACQNQNTSPPAPQEILARLILTMCELSLLELWHLAYALPSFKSASAQFDNLRGVVYEYFTLVLALCSGGSFRKLSSAIQAVLLSSKILFTRVFYASFVPDTYPLALKLTICHLLSELDLCHLPVWRERLLKIGDHFRPQSGGGSMGVNEPCVVLPERQVIRQNCLMLYANYLATFAVDAVALLLLVKDLPLLVVDIVLLIDESPIVDIVGRLHTSEHISCIWLDSLDNANVQQQLRKKPSFACKLLKYLDKVHVDATWRLLEFVVSNVLKLPFLVVVRQGENLACRFVKKLLVAEDPLRRLPMDKLKGLCRDLNSAEFNSNREFVAQLLSDLLALCQRFATVASRPVEATDALMLQKSALKTASPDLSASSASLCIASLRESFPAASAQRFSKLRFVKIIKDTDTLCSAAAFAQLMLPLLYEEALEILTTEGISPDQLRNCLETGLQELFELLSVEPNSSTLPTPIGSPASSANLFETYSVLNSAKYPLACASKVAILRYLKNLLGRGRVIHQLPTFDGCEPTLVPTFSQALLDESNRVLAFADCLRSLSSNLRFLKPFTVQDLQSIASFVVTACRAAALMSKTSQTGFGIGDFLQLLRFLKTVLCSCSELADLLASLQHVTDDKAALVNQCSMINSVYVTLCSVECMGATASALECLLPSKLPCDMGPLQTCAARRALAMLTWLEQCQEMRSQSNLAANSNWTNERCGGDQPHEIMLLLSGVIISLCRLPAVNSFCRCPTAVFRYGWEPEPKRIRIQISRQTGNRIPSTDVFSETTANEELEKGEFFYCLPATPVHFLQNNLDVLQEFIRRVNFIGWTDRQQFEEAWMALIGVLSSTPVGQELSSEAQLEIAERISTSCLAVRCLSSLLLQSLVVPKPGNPTRGYFLLRNRERRSPFLKSMYGKRLLCLMHKIGSLSSHGVDRRNFVQGVLYQKSSVPLFNANVERLFEVGTYGFGQLSVETLWSVTGILAEERKLVVSVAEPPLLPPVTLDPSKLSLAAPPPIVSTAASLKLTSVEPQAEEITESSKELFQGGPTMVESDPLSVALHQGPTQAQSQIATINVNAVILRKRSSPDSEPDNKRPENIAVSQHLSEAFDQVVSISGGGSGATETQPLIRRSGSGFLLLSDSGLDLLSSLHFLLDLYSHWLEPNVDNVPIPLLSATVESMVLLSDVFTERSQYEWLLQLLKSILQQRPPGEDELLFQYIVFGTLKCAAVLGVNDAESKRHLLEVLQFGLANPQLSVRSCTLAGCLYFFQSVTLAEETFGALSIVIDYVQNQLLCLVDRNAWELDSEDTGQLSRIPPPLSVQHMLLALANAFYIVETYVDEPSRASFLPKLQEICLKCVSVDESRIPLMLYTSVIYSLQSLLVSCPVDLMFLSKLANAASRTVQRVSDSARTIPTIELLLTCLYVGKGDRSYYEVHTPETETMPPLPERHISAMERLTLFLSKISRGLPEEASVVAAVLPSFLADNFSPGDVINKVISDFLSPTQAHPKLAARVVFQVFETLRERETSFVVSDWALLSLPNFTNKTPVQFAVWSLGCFLLSACSNQWTRAFFPLAVERYGKLEEFDNCLFCFIMASFRSQLEDSSQIESLWLTMKDADRRNPNTSYRLAVDLLSSLNQAAS